MAAALPAEMAARRDAFADSERAVEAAVAMRLAANVEAARSQASFAAAFAVALELRTVEWHLGEPERARIEAALTLPEGAR